MWGQHLTLLTFCISVTLGDTEQKGSAMSGRTVLNERYEGIVESVSIPAELHERDGKRFASSDGVVPIHCCTPEEIAVRAATTHHYCDLFSDRALAPLDELAYVRLDHAHAEKVFINRSKRLLLTSSDGRLAQWRSAPSFESANLYVAGAPLTDLRGRLVSVVTARVGNHYAISNIEGDGGYFETPLPWRVIEPPAHAPLYADRAFPSRDALRDHVAALSPPRVTATHPPEPLLCRPAPAATPATPAAPVRVMLLAEGGRQLAHYYLHSVNASVEYL